MTIKELIESLRELQSMYELSDDTEVLITDGWDCKGYRGDFVIQRYIAPGSKTVYADIGIGGLEYAE